MGAVETRLMSGRAPEMSFLEEKRVAEEVEVVVVVSTVISTATSTCVGHKEMAHTIDKNHGMRRAPECKA
jgi:hypothetical protein